MKTKEGWPEGLPSLIPTSKNLEEAITSITAPIRAMTECISWTAKEMTVEDQTTIKCTLFDFLKQLNFILYYGEINGEPIWRAEINYPFKVSYRDKEEENDQA